MIRDGIRRTPTSRSSGAERHPYKLLVAGSNPAGRTAAVLNPELIATE